MDQEIKTVIQYPTGSTEFDIPFDYLSRKFVRVSLVSDDNRRLLNNITEYRYVSKTRVKLLVATTGFDRVEIRRFTSASERVVDFSDGSVLRANDLNVSQLQSAHIAEEARDAALLAMPEDDAGNLDARNRKIVRLAPGELGTDAVNKNQLDTTLGEAGGILSDIKDLSDDIREYTQTFADDTTMVKSVAWVYNGGAALGGETSFVIDRPEPVLSVPYIEINGSRNYRGWHYSYDQAERRVTLVKPLSQNDFVVCITAESKLPLSDLLGSAEGASGIGVTGGGSVQDYIDIVKASGQSVIYAAAHGVVADDSVDVSDKLQALIDSSGRTPIILPPTIAIKKPIVYRSRTVLLGHQESFTQVKLMNGFSGTSAFVPASKAQTGTDSAILAYLNIVDLSAVNVGAGSNSTKCGIDVTGSFNLKLLAITGVRLDNTIVSEPGTALQHTRRLRIDGLNGSNVNRHIYMPGDGTSRFSYGDIYINDFKTSASCARSSVIESTDGLQVIGAVIFPNGGLRVSGNYITITGCHLFEPKAPLGSGEIPAGIHVTKRTPTVYSEYVNISATAVAFAGRLANTTIGNPAQVNEGAPGILIERVRVFNIQVSVNHSSKESMRIVESTNGVVSLASREANTQLLGSGALPPGTYDSLRLEGCGEVVVQMSDTSASRQHAVYMDDECVGCVVTGAAGRGHILGTNVRLPLNPQNRVLMTFDGEGSTRSLYDSNPPINRFVTAPTGSTAPSVTGGINNMFVTFQNGAVTNVTDLPDVPARREVTVNLNDNNATRLVSTVNGGKFRTRDGNNIMGRGAFARFIRDPATGDLVQL